MSAFLSEAESLLSSLTEQTAIGTLRDALKAHLKSGGKRLRMRLAVEATAAFGGNMTLAPAWGAACELLHNATLIHDDLQDGDTHRRGHPTVWTIYGASDAINAGDFMLLLPFAAIKAIPTEASEVLRWRLADALATSALNTVQGQSGELELPRYVGSHELKARYITCIDQKTSSLFELPVKGAALLAGLSLVEASNVANEVRSMGTLFQIQDDILDLFGDKGRDKPGADLREGKMSSLVVEHLVLHPQETEALSALLKTPRNETSDADVAFWIRRFAEGGALRAALHEIEIRKSAIHKSEILKLHPALRARVSELLEMILKPIAHLGQIGELRS